MVEELLDVEATPSFRGSDRTSWLRSGPARPCRRTWPAHVSEFFWQLTGLWAAVCLGKAVMVLWLLLSQSMETFVLAKSISVLALNAVAVVTTIAAAAVVARKEGLLGPLPAPA